jgi:hypothetical protein
MFNERVSLVGDELPAQIAYGAKICRCLYLHIELKFDFEVPEELVDFLFCEATRHWVSCAVIFRSQKQILGAV